MGDFDFNFAQQLMANGGSQGLFGGNINPTLLKIGALLGKLGGGIGAASNTPLGNAAAAVGGFATDALKDYNTANLINRVTGQSALNNLPQILPGIGTSNTKGDDVGYPTPQVGRQVSPQPTSFPYSPQSAMETTAPVAAPQPFQPNDILSKLSNPQDATTGMTLNPDGSVKSISGVYNPQQGQQVGGVAQSTNPFLKKLQEMFPG